MAKRFETLFCGREVKMKIFIKYIKIWFLMSRNSFLGVLYYKFGLSVLLIGKVLRFIFFFSFIYFLLIGTKNLAGYSLNQTLFFFLTFNLIDVVSQFFFREVYRFRPLIVSGDLDLVLVKPQNALFRVLLGGADIIDLLTIPPLIFAVFWFGRTLHPDLYSAILYVFMIINGLIVSAAFHISVLSFGIITFEVDNIVLIYRDLESLARFPIDIYKEPLKSLLTYFLPIGVMITFPAKALMGLISPSGVLISFLTGTLCIFASLKLWNYALKKYTSASS